MRQRSLPGDARARALDARLRDHQRIEDPIGEPWGQAAEPPSKYTHVPAGGHQPVALSDRIKSDRDYRPAELPVDLAEETMSPPTVTAPDAVTAKNPWPSGVRATATKGLPLDFDNASTSSGELGEDSTTLPNRRRRCVAQVLAVAVAVANIQGEGCVRA